MTTVTQVPNRPNAMPNERTYQISGRTRDYKFAVVPHHEFQERWLCMGGRYGRTITVYRHERGYLYCHSCGAGCFHADAVDAWLRDEAARYAPEMAVA